MTEVEEMQYLIDHDTEFARLHQDAMKNTNSIFDDEAEDILELRNHFFPFWSLKEFFAKYKVILGWSAMMGQVLQKIHGMDSLDSKALRPISGTNAGYIIYHDPRPWMIRVKLDKLLKETIIDLDVAIHDDGGIGEANIQFSLQQPEIIVNPVTGSITPNLLGSKMTVRLFEEDTNKIIYSEDCLVKDFTPDWLGHVLKVGLNIK